MTGTLAILAVVVVSMGWLVWKIPNYMRKMGDL